MSNPGDRPGERISQRQTPDFPSRRSFLGVLLGAGTGCVGALLSVPLIRFVLHPLLKTTAMTVWYEVGQAEEFQSILLPVMKPVTVEQRDGWRKMVSEKAVYVFKDERGQLGVLSAVCPHLGCSVSWHGAKNKFVCPCHNGLFAADGKLQGGPPPRGMDRLESTIERGVLKVRYQYFRQLVPQKEIMA